jgi:outer membrane protein insertion porin family
MKSTPTTAFHRTGRTALCCVAAALLLLTGSLLAQPVQPVVSRITASGNRLLTEQQILGRLGVKPGAPLDRQALDSAVEEWNRSGLYGALSCRVEPAEEEGRVGLVLSLAERVRLQGVSFRGNTHLKSDELAARVTVGAHDAVTEADVRAAQRRIQQAYQEAGYPHLAVRGLLEGVEAGAPVLVFEVHEGVRAWVERIEFAGNEQVPGDKLLEAMNARTRHWPSSIWPGWYDEDVFRADIPRIEAAMRAEGFQDAKATGEARFSRDGARVVLHVDVVEGRLYRVGQVGFEGNQLFRDQELLEAAALRPGDPYSPQALGQALEAISRLYAEQGRWDVNPEQGNLQVQDTYSAEGAEVSLHFRIREGEPVYIRRIDIQGLVKTKEAVVRRSLTFYPGEMATASKIEESKRALLNTGYFDLEALHPPVDITLTPGPDALRDAVVRVEEGPTGRIMAGAGVNSDFGIIGSISIVEENFDIWNWPRKWSDIWEGNAFRGGGQTLSLILRAGTRRSYYSISFDNPSLRDTDYSFGTELYRRGSTRQEFDETRTGLALRVGEALSPFVRRNLTVGYESISVDNIATGSPTEITQEKGSHSKAFVRLGGTADHRDNRFDPSEGYYLSGQVELSAGEALQAKLEAAAEKYWTLRQQRGDTLKHVLALRGQAGVVTAAGGVPVFERFYAGGMGSLRGFAFEGAAPSDSPTGKLIGGDSMLLGSVEYSFPVSRSDRWRLLAFSDAGLISEGIMPNPADLRLSVGTGVRWKAPILGAIPIELDLAIPVVSKSDDSTQILHFSVAAQRRF